VFKAHKLVHHSTLGSGFIKKRRKKGGAKGNDRPRLLSPRAPSPPGLGSTAALARWCLGFSVSGLGFRVKG